MIERFARILGLAALSLLASGCPDSNGSECPEPCDRGFRCDPVTATCLPSPLPEYRRDIPGRAVRVASSGDLVWSASLDTSDGGLVVAERDESGNRDARVLATPTISPERRLSIDASGRMLAVAWLGTTGRYEIAYRQLPGDHSVWNFATIVEPRGENYAGSNDFDLEIRNDRSVAIAFRDRNRSLRILRAEDPSSEEWSLEDVDDGGATDDGITCPDDLRRISPALGVGFHPDVESRGDQLLISYQDADCGDLRLARRGANRWTVDAVDTGESGATADGRRAFVGSFSSVAFGPAGDVRIAYHDSSRGRLLIASEDDGRFDIDVVDPGFAIDEFSRQRKKLVGTFAQLSIGNDGAMVVTYFDATFGDLRIARRETNAGEWARESLASSNAVGFFADHAARADGTYIVVAEELSASAGSLSSMLTVVEEEQ